MISHYVLFYLSTHFLQNSTAITFHSPCPGIRVKLALYKQLSWSLLQSCTQCVMLAFTSNMYVLFWGALTLQMRTMEWTAARCLMSVFIPEETKVTRLRCFLTSGFVWHSCEQSLNRLTRSFQVLIVLGTDGLSSTSGLQSIFFLVVRTGRSLHCCLSEKTERWDQLL